MIEDLAKSSKKLKFNVSNMETAEEIEARIRRDEKDSDHEQKKELIILWAVVLVVGLVSAVCVVVVFLPHSSPDSVKWATTLLTTVVAGGVGYMTGKGSRT